MQTAAASAEQPKAGVAVVPAAVDLKPTQVEPVMPPKPLAAAPKVPPPWPTVLEPGSAPKVPGIWTDAEIAAERAVCAKLLAGLPLTVEAVEPFRDGECGSPAAVLLIAVGRKPEVSLQPPVVVSCEMAATMARWVVGELQPLAQKHLKAHVTRIDTMSSYSCRNAYGRKKTRLSEHGRANAIDIRSFITASAQTVTVLDDWGMTERAVQAKIAAAKAEAARIAAAAAKAAAAKAAVAKAGTPDPAAKQPPSPAVAATLPPPAEVEPKQAEAPAPQLRGIIGDMPSLARRIQGLTRQPDTAFGFDGMSRLGGLSQKAAAAPVAPVVELPAKGPVSSANRFLHEVHASACRTFATVLGPEANTAHENHFHFDMAERSGRHFCE